MVAARREVRGNTRGSVRDQTCGIATKQQIEAKLFDLVDGRQQGILMKKLVVSAAALLAFGGPALAADLPPQPYTKAPVYTAPAAI